MSSQQGRYLSGKSYHPSTQANQRKVWEAEQAAAAQASRERERQQMLKAERARFEASAVERGVDVSEIHARDSVSFMYKPPPGFFRDRDAEEKADRERKQEDPRLLTWKDKFPEIRGAPTATGEVKQMDLRVNMLGKVLRGVQCTKCHAWGHKATERECPMRDVLVQADIDRRDREDPLHTMNVAGDTAAASGIIIKEDIVIRGGGDSTHENQRLLPPDPNEDAPAAVVDEDDEAFVRSLTPDERRALLKSLKKKDRKRKRDRPHRKHRHRSRSRSPSHDSAGRRPSKR
ncbi:unnamed protein product (mitochondrion) [Plasmodiophora brassicae]|uniref:CBF1-interacting co-repressor CIR N-terminal domain-containing protein n=1 Tax=Plasmodiophora brassicae TaxID=37360 RepID=A0A0G4IZ99_PLABS|nr:hypothetical protein PBRA_001445 [Plasmodiophora brassicae]SPQ94099.1 unnamed protein product [Plasmodiophora brassicae]